MPSAEEHQLNWLQRIFQRLGGTRQGDVVAVQIGDSAQHVIVGKNIIQIGSVSIPIWLLVVPFGVLLSIFSLSVYQVLIPLLPRAMPEGAFNIAVAEFDAVNEQGTPEPNQDAAELSLSIANLLDNQQDTLTNVLGQQVVIWGPDRGIAPVRAGEETIRTHALNADAMIYGSVNPTRQGHWAVNPKFYLADAAVGQAHELRGEYALGTSITYRPENTASLRDLNDTLRNRLAALSEILLGLSYMTYGDAEGYRRAVEVFQRVADETEWGKEQNTGQEILYLFLGNAYLKYSSMVDELELRSQLLTKSQTAYEQAIAQNPEYVRSYNGLGSALMAQAHEPTADICEWNWSLLEEAASAYRYSLEAPEENKPLSGHVDLRAHLGLGRIYFWFGYCLSEESQPEEWQQADYHHQAALNAYQADPQPFLHLLAILARLDLGDIAYYQLKRIVDAGGASQEGQTLHEEAQMHYRAALDLALALKTDEGDFQAVTAAAQLMNELCFHGESDQSEAIVEEVATQLTDPDAVRAELIALTQEECGNAHSSIN